MYRYKVNIEGDFEVLGDSPSRVNEFVKRFIDEHKFENKNIEVKVSLMKGGDTTPIETDENSKGTNKPEDTPKRKSKTRKPDR